LKKKNGKAIYNLRGVISFTGIIKTVNYKTQYRSELK